MEQLLLKAIKALAKNAPELKGPEKSEPEKISDTFIHKCLSARINHCRKNLEEILSSEKIYTTGLWSNFHVIVDPIKKKDFNVETYEKMLKLLEESFITTEDLDKLNMQELTYIIKGALLIGAKDEFEIKTIQAVFLTYEYKTWNEYTRNKQEQ